MLRVKLLRGGKATATDIVDADSVLTQARLQRVNAHIDAHVAYAKLDHAVGGFGTATGRSSSKRQLGPRRSALAKPRKRR